MPITCQRTLLVPAFVALMGFACGKDTPRSTAPSQLRVSGDSSPEVVCSIASVHGKGGEGKAITIRVGEGPACTLPTNQHALVLLLQPARSACIGEHTALEIEEVLKVRMSHLGHPAAVTCRGGRCEIRISEPQSPMVVARAADLALSPGHFELRPTVSWVDFEYSYSRAPPNPELACQSSEQWVQYMRDEEARFEGAQASSSSYSPRDKFRTLVSLEGPPAPKNRRYVMTETGSAASWSFDASRSIGEGFSHEGRVIRFRAGLHTRQWLDAARKMGVRDQAVVLDGMWIGALYGADETAQTRILDFVVPDARWKDPAARHTALLAAPMAIPLELVMVAEVGRCGAFLCGVPIGMARSLDLCISVEDESDVKEEVVRTFTRGTHSTCEEQAVSHLESVFQAILTPRGAVSPPLQRAVPLSMGSSGFDAEIAAIVLQAQRLRTPESIRALVPLAGGGDEAASHAAGTALAYAALLAPEAYLEAVQAGSVDEQDILLQYLVSLSDEDGSIRAFLLDVAQSESPRVALSAIKSFLVLGGRGDACAPVFCRLLDDRSPALRFEAILAIGEGPCAHETINRALRRIADSESGWLQIVARACLTRLGLATEADLDVLVAAEASEKARMRWIAMWSKRD